MAKTDDKVMKMVEDELAKNPDIAVTELFEKAKGASPEVKKLTLRQFNARFPLQVKRRKNRAAGGGRRRRPAPRKRGRARSGAGDLNRDAIRGAFLSFAMAVTAAEDKKDLVKVLAGVDRYVDDVIKGVNGK